MVHYIKETYLNILWGYDPKEFFPVLYEGRLQNKGAFAAYKLKQLVKTVL